MHPLLDRPPKTGENTQTAFFYYLRYLRRSGDFPLSWTEIESGCLMSAQILLVEDDTVIRGDVRECLLKAGYEVAEAKDGAQALELVSSREFDLVITDFVMPKLDGFKLIEAIRFKSPETPVIFMTGYLSADSGQIILQGTAEFIHKPFTPEVLLSTVQRLLRPKLFFGNDILALYRKAKGSDTWHFCSNCAGWPTSDYEEDINIASPGATCNECEVKGHQGNCR